MQIIPSSQPHTSRHRRIAEHKNSTIGRHFIEWKPPIQGFEKVSEQIWLFGFWNDFHEEKQV